jgi:hypothetical protein
MDTTLCNDKKKEKKRKGKDNKVHDITVHKTMEQLQNTPKHASLDWAM